MQRHLPANYLLFSIAICMLIAGTVQGQLGGFNTYKFLNLSPSARISALGGNLITVRDDDINLAYANPGLLNESMHQAMGFSHSFYLSDISYGYAAYGHHVEKWNTTLHGGVQYVNYGEFNQTNILGEIEGEFKAAEYSVTLGAAYPIYDRMMAGLNVKYITSQLAGYNSSGLAADLSMVYYDTATNFTATILARNVGTQFSAYGEESSIEPIPTEIQIGFSKKLKYLPFRFSIIYRYLDQWNILYDDPNKEQSTLFFGDVESEPSPSSVWFDNFFRHFVFNGEFLLGKKENFRLRAGYSHMMRKELSVENFRSLAGFSFGVGFKINRFRIDFGHTTFHLAGGLNHFSVSTNLKEFR